MERSWRVELDGSVVADALVVNRAELLVREAREVVLVAAWADLHDEDSVAGDGSGRVLAGTERARAYGGHGTPRVGEFACAELAVLLGVGHGSAAHLLRDVLDLRERHPRLWAQLDAAAHADPAAVGSGTVSGPRVWQARRVAAACHAAGLTRGQARWVDAQTSPYLASLPWGRFEDLLAAKVIEVDPAAAEARRTAEAMRRFVATGQCNEHGLKTLIVKANAGDVICLVALLDRVARILAVEGDPDPVEVRRAKAVRIVANPYECTRLLEKHAHPDTSDTRSGTSAADAAVPAGGDDAHARADDAEGGDASAGGAGGEGANGVLDLFADRRVHPGESTTDPPATPVRGPADPGPPGTPDDPPDDPPAPERLAPGDLHPSTDDSDDPEDSVDSGARPAAACAACGHRPAADVPGQSSARSRARGRARPVDPDRLLPHATLYVHVSQQAFTRDADGVARFENGIGPVTVAQAVEFLGHRRVSVTPVLDLADQVPVAAYEIPARLREAVHLARPASVFPYSGHTSRHLDLDHTTAYRTTPAHPDTDPDTGRPNPDRPAAQTRLGNLGPLARYEHRVKTHARGWTLTQPTPGVYLWRTRHGHRFRVDHTGTHRLGRHPAPASRSPLEAAFAALIAA